MTKPKYRFKTREELISEYPDNIHYVDEKKLVMLFLSAFVSSMNKYLGKEISSAYNRNLNDLYTGKRTLCTYEGWSICKEMITPIKVNPEQDKIEFYKDLAL